MKEEISKKILSQIKLPKTKYEKPFIIAMSGYSGSGKSTIAKVFSSELGCYIVGGDKIRSIIYNDQNANHNFDFIQEVTNYTYENELKFLLKNHVSVVIDRSISSMKNLEDIKSYGYQVILIKLISDHETNIYRVCNRKPCPIKIENTYGDIGEYSGVTNKEIYEEIRQRKVYDIDDNLFDYKINTVKSFEDVLNDAYNIANKIKKLNEK